jgi:phosphatidylinositol glycan class V
MRLLLVTRIIMLGLVVLSDSLITDHAAQGVLELKYEPTSSLHGIFTRPFLKWDAAHLLTIAEEGYITEQSFAFFPAYPMLIRYLAKVIKLVSPVYMNSIELNVLCGFAISNLCFVASCGLLNELLEFLGASTLTRKYAIMCYAFNPATIFFLGIYTESMYSLLLLLGIYYLIVHPNDLYACLIFTLASFTRSNGVFNAVLVAVRSITIFLEDANESVRMKKCISMFFVFLGTVFPYYVINLNAYSTLCLEGNIGINSDVCRLGSVDSIPNVYSYVQWKYWNVGFLNSYRINQIPNIALAIPMVLTVLRTLQIFTFSDSPVCFSGAVGLKGGNWPQVLPLLCATYVQFIISLCFAHIQVITRLMCASCPLIYVAMAECFASNDIKISRKLMLGYILVFNILGLILHPNFYPWT